MRRLLVLVALVFALDARAVTIDWVEVGNPNNPSDAPSHCLNSPANCGSVDHAYYISKFEVTNAPYAEFLNAKAASDPLGLYNEAMGSDATFGGITRSGVSGSYTYTAKPGFENKPVVYVSFFDALRFSNWLNNGEGIGDTETGAYTVTADGIANNSITRNPGAITFLTSENEWYKAAYYDPISKGYFDYPAGSNTQPGCAPVTTSPNAANCGRTVRTLTDAGSYTRSASPNGTFDQGGNVWEWDEEIGPIELPAGLFYRGIRGGDWYTPAEYLAAYRGGHDGGAGGHDVPEDESVHIGFRVASLVPEPGPGLLGMMGVLSVLGLSASRRRRAN